VVDDITTTGRTANAFIERMESAGAHVRMAMFLAKTRNFKRHN
jgi:adenine/guanine phosphoribosyltransferase-like PRPP-binding protein